MARRVVDLHPEAIAEGREARLWYRLRSQTVEERFRVALRRAIGNIREAPERWPADDDGLRDCRVAGFPYRLIYLDRRRLLPRGRHRAQQVASGLLEGPASVGRLLGD